MGTQPEITASTNQPEGLVHVWRDGREVVVLTTGEARQLLSELACELLEHATDHRLGQALGDLLEALTAGLTRRDNR